MISRKEKEESQSPLTRRSAPLFWLLWSYWAGTVTLCFPREEEEEVMGLVPASECPGTVLLTLDPCGAWLTMQQCLAEDRTMSNLQLASVPDPTS